jgi:hypothetical protein
MVADLGCHAYEPSHPAPAGVAGPMPADGRGRWSVRGPGRRGSWFGMCCSMYVRVAWLDVCIQGSTSDASREKLREESRK